MKILLINLPRESETKDYTTREYLLTDYVCYPPLGLLAIAAKVNPAHSIKVLDCVAKGLSIEDTVKYIIEYNPNVLGISVVTRRLYALSRISRRIKESLPGTIIVAGGPHINYWPEETMRLGSVDYAIPGYGENAFPLLIEALSGGIPSQSLAGIPNLYYLSNGQIYHNPADEIPRVLDSLPFPDRKLVNLNDYYTAIDKVHMTTMYSSRGCPFHCIFCDVQEKTYRYRSATAVVNEFEEIIKLGIKEIHIFDDTFNADPKRLKEICNEILKRRLKVRWSSRARVVPFDREMMRLLKEAGCVRLHIGVESLSPTLLKYMNKQQTLEQIHSFFKLCREFKMETVGYFIIGFRDETEEYRKSLLKEVFKLGITYAFCNILYPLPKTNYYQSLLDDGTFKEDYWAGFFRKPTKDFNLPLPRSAQLQSELEKFADDFHRQFCFRPGFIWREMRKCVLQPKMLIHRAKLAFSLMFHG